MKRVRLVIIIAITITLLFALNIRSSFLIEDNEDILEEEKLLRLHVIANSNSLEDQRIKREVRNEIIKKTSQLFVSLKDPLDAKGVVQENSSLIRKIINEKLRSYKQTYNVSLELGKFNFPTRNYGGVTLAAGEYEALRVVIGEGKGENWWCVLFPPLCFVDSMNELTESDMKELAMTNNKKREEIPVEFRFKIFEFVKENPQWVKSKLKLAQILEASFPGLKKLLLLSESNGENK